jgi:hypothetical protein
MIYIYQEEGMLRGMMIFLTTPRLLSVSGLSVYMIAGLKISSVAQSYYLPLFCRAHSVYVKAAHLSYVQTFCLVIL